MVKLHKSDETSVSPIRRAESAGTDKPSKWLTPFEEMSHFFENISHRNWMRPLHMDWPDWRHMHSPFAGKLPHVDVIERDDEIVLHAELPGVEKKDLEVSMTDHAITIKGTTDYEEKEEKGNYFRSEIAHGAFSRTVLLPIDVDLDNVKSNFKNGLLEVHVPKLEKASRKITIN